MKCFLGFFYVLSGKDLRTFVRWINVPWTSSLFSITFRTELPSAIPLFLFANSLCFSACAFICVKRLEVLNKMLFCNWAWFSNFLSTCTSQNYFMCETIMLQVVVNGWVSNQLGISNEFHHVSHVCFWLSGRYSSDSNVQVSIQYPLSLVFFFSNVSSFRIHPFKKKKLLWYVWNMIFWRWYGKYLCPPVYGRVIYLLRG